MFTLEIELGNDAMQDAEDIARALDAVADRVQAEAGVTKSGLIMDENGNTVGNWSYENAYVENDLAAS